MLLQRMFKVIEAGANALVAGSAVFGAKSYPDAISGIKTSKRLQEATVASSTATAKALSGCRGLVEMFLYISIGNHVNLGQIPIIVLLSWVALYFYSRFSQIINREPLKYSHLAYMNSNFQLMANGDLSNITGGILYRT